MHFIDLAADPFVPEGWEVVQHIKGGQLNLDSVRVVLYLHSQQQRGKMIQGNQLYKTLKGMQVFNANLLDHLLQNTEFIMQLIPEAQENDALVFWGTIYRDQLSRLCVRFLYKVCGAWFWGWCLFSDDFDYHRPAVVSAPIFVKSE